MSGVLCVLVGGAADTAVTLTDDSVNSSGSGSRSATFEINSDRSINHVLTGLGSVYQYDWLESYADPANYEARVTLNTGTLYSGTTGTWLALDTVRQWTVLSNTPSTLVEAEITVEIRNALTTIVLETATVFLSAERTT